MGLHDGRITIDQARAFVLAASQRSYADAATESAKSPTPLGSAKTIRANIKRLGENLNREGLVKTATRDAVELTAVGTEVFPLVQAFVNAYDDLVQKPNTVRFCAYPSAIANLMRAKRELLEGPDPVLVPHDIADRHRGNRGAQLMQKLRQREVDLIVAPTQPVSGSLKEEQAYTWSLRAVLPKGSPRRQTLPLRDVLGRPFACAPSGHTSRSMLEEAAGRLGAELNVLIESTDPHALRAVALASSGIVAVLPDDAFGAPDPAMGPQVLVDGAPLEGHFSVYYNKGVPEPRLTMIKKAADLVLAALRGE